MKDTNQQKGIKQFVNFLKTTLSQYWWLFGILSLLSFALCSDIGWYTLANFLVFGGGVYLVKKAEERQKRLLENPKFLLRMNRQQKKNFLALDEQETRNLASSTLLIFWLSIACLFLDAYTYFFNQVNHRHAAIFPWWQDNSTLNLIFFIVGIIFGLFYCVTWKIHLNDTKVQFINYKAQKV